MTAAVDGKKFSVPLSSFVGNTPLIVQPEGMTYAVSVQRIDEGNFRALVLRCTHASNQLTETGNGFYCDAHGSRFDIEGNVTKGPASHPLDHLQTEVLGNVLTIELI